MVLLLSLILETAGTMIYQFCYLRTRKKKAKLAIYQDKEKTNSNKVKFPEKRKSKFTNRSSRENNNKKKRLMLDN